ncbi:MAG TPA: hypothetical protein PLQ15_09775 [Syntrophales bacterium]|nr:hypothetical protein [Syntrophobacterales bacterium]HQL90878.1 hypothetical protein [Syntrophales bacterium]
MKLIVTVDTEADSQWTYKGRISVANLRCLPRFQALCERYGFVATYLLASEVLKDRAAVRQLKGWHDGGRAEVGTHLEPWTTPPFMAAERENPALQLFPSALPASWFERKLRVLTEGIAERFGSAPRSFRAARWGLGASMVGALARQGYRVDCSVTPKTSWAEAGDGPDYRRAPARPYRLSGTDVCVTGDSRLLEAPLTVLHTGPLVREGSGAARRFALLPESPAKRLLDRIVFRTKWLRISPASRRGDWRAIHRAAVRSGMEVLVFMIHSSELAPGTSPLTPTERDAEGVFRRLEEMFGDFRALGVTGCTLGSLAGECGDSGDGTRERSAREAPKPGYPQGDVREPSAMAER